MKQFLLKIYILIRFKFLNFILLNLKGVKSGRLVYSSLPNCQQKTLFTGAGTVNIGSLCQFGYVYGGFHKKGRIELQPRYKDAQIKIGNNVATNNNIFICAALLIEIGNNTLIGQNVTIMDFEAHNMHPDKRRELGAIGPIKIGNNVWIGNNVIILKNTNIGDNTIVAAGAVVSGIIPSNAVIGGIPAKVIKYL